MSQPLNGDRPTAQFALVSYIPAPLGAFLDDLRREMIPHCDPHAHVTILPPRPLLARSGIAAAELRNLAREFPPFEVRLGAVERFRESEVIYLEIAAGAAELRRMHAALNRDSVRFEEPFPYCPHVTLAQDLVPAALPSLKRMAEERWAEYRGPRAFQVSQLAFVENTGDNGWVDLADIQLSVPAPVACKPA